MSDAKDNVFSLKKLLKNNLNIYVLHDGELLSFLVSSSSLEQSIKLFSMDIESTCFESISVDDVGFLMKNGIDVYSEGGEFFITETCMHKVLAPAFMDLYLKTNKEL